MMQGDKDRILVAAIAFAMIVVAVGTYMLQLPVKYGDLNWP